MLLNLPNLNVFINTDHILEVSHVMKAVKEDHYKFYIHLNTSGSLPHTYTMVYESEEEANDNLFSIVERINVRR